MNESGSIRVLVNYQVNGIVGDLAVSEDMYRVGTVGVHGSIVVDLAAFAASHESDTLRAYSSPADSNYFCSMLSI